jgi:hypothetical protein
MDLRVQRGNNLGFESAPGFRLSREFETSSYDDLCHAPNLREIVYRKPRPFSSSVGEPKVHGRLSLNS